MTQEMGKKPFTFDSNGNLIWIDQLMNPEKMPANTEALKQGKVTDVDSPTGSPGAGGADHSP